MVWRRCWLSPCPHRPTFSAVSADVALTWGWRQHFWYAQGLKQTAVRAVLTLLCCPPSPSPRPRHQRDSITLVQFSPLPFPALPTCPWQRGCRTRLNFPPPPSSRALWQGDCLSRLYCPPPPPCPRAPRHRGCRTRPHLPPFPSPPPSYQGERLTRQLPRIPPSHPAVNAAASSVVGDCGRSGSGGRDIRLGTMAPCLSVAIFCG